VRRLIFLDFDGVLNSHQWMLRRAESKRERGAVLGLDPAAVGLLNQLLDRSRAKVVVSSTHRLAGLPHCKRLLKSTGFTGEVIGATPVLDMLRGLEIQAWLDAQVARDRFVILDDDAQDMAHLREHLIQTGFHAGLTQAHVDEAVTRLRQRETT